MEIYVVHQAMKSTFEQNMRLLSRLMRAINNADSMNQLLDRVLELTIELLDFDAGLIYDVDPVRQVAEVRSYYGMEAGRLSVYDCIPTTTDPFSRVFVEGLPLVWDGNNQPVKSRQNKRTGHKMEVMIPLFKDGLIRGAMRIWCRGKRLFTHEDASILVSIGEMLENGSQQIKLQEEIKESNYNLENLINGVEDLVMVLNMQGTILRVNEAVILRLGYASRELINTNVQDLYCPTQPELLNQIIQDTLEGRRTSHQATLATKFGHKIEIESCFNLGKWSGERVLIGISRDISELRRQEREITDINNSYDRLTTFAGETIFRFQLETEEVTYVNPAALAISGYSRDHWLNDAKFMTELIHPDSMPAFREILQQFRLGQVQPETVSLQWIDREGQVKVLEHTFVLVRDTKGRVRYVECIARNITAQKQAEEALRRSEERYALVLEGVRDGIWDWDLESGEAYNSERLREIIGRNVVLRPDNWLEHVHPEDHEKLAMVMQQYINGLLLRQEIEHRLKRPDGSYIWVLNRGNAIQNTAGRVVRIVGSINDISQRKIMEEELRISEARYRMVVEEQTELIYRFTRDGQVTFVNDAACRCFQREKKAIVDHHVAGDILAEDIHKLYNCLNLINKKRPIATIELRVVMPDGGIRWQQWTVRAIFNLYGDIIEYQSVGRDVTEGKQLEETLKYLSMHDTLTGLYNRGFFDEHMKNIDSGADMLPAGIILCDINDLKSINDNYGHKTGDEMIILAARVLQACFHSPQVVARIGGDEFAILVPNTTYHEIQEYCHKIRNSIAAHNESQQISLPLAMSIGYALKDSFNEDMENAFIKADGMMYQEKAEYKEVRTPKH